MNRSKVLGLLTAAGGLSVSALGQVTVPTAYMWAPEIPGGWPQHTVGSISYDLRDLTPMVHIDTNYNVPDGSGGFVDPVTHPAQAGAYAAQQAIAIAHPSGSSITYKVCLVIKEFGKGGDPNTTASLNARNYFTANDYPPAPSGGSFAWPGSTVDGTNKPYLHPFLVNANSGLASVTARPLRDWMAAFIAGYNGVSGRPIPTACYFDNEVTLASPVSKNAIYVLTHLSMLTVASGTTDAYWDATLAGGAPKYPVPGQDPSKTLKQLYLDAAAKYTLEHDPLQRASPRAWAGSLRHTRLR